MKPESQHNATFAPDWPVIFSLLAIAGAITYSLIAPAPATPALDAYVGETVALEGTIVRDPDIREKTTHLTVEINQIAGSPVPKTRVLVFADRFTDVQYGDRVAINGNIQRPEAFQTDTERTFDYPKYLLAHGIQHTVSFPEISVVQIGEGNPIVAGLLSVKHFFMSGIEKALPEPESALLAGLLLGEKQSLGDSITDAFRAAGVIHIIVLSGYNVALVIKAVLHVAGSFLPRVYAFSVASIAIFAFAIMTGASETTIRASLMAGIVLVAQLLKRPTEGVRILLLAAAAMAVVNPYLVLYDLSYQLSVLATLGLVLFSDAIAKHLTFVTEKIALREIVATTVATQITVLPLLILSVGQVSVVSLIANVLVLPAVPVAMLVGFIASLVASVSWMLALPFSALAYTVLRYIIDISVGLGELPLSSFTVPQSWVLPALAVLLGAYLIVFAALSGFGRKLRIR